MRFADARQLRVNSFALVHHQRTARVKTTAGRQVNRVGGFPLQDHALLSHARVWHRDDRKQRLSVGMFRLLQHLAHRPDLDDAPKIHDRDAVREITDRAEVVRDEDDRDIARLTQFCQQVDDLGADGNIQHRDGLICKQQVRFQHERAGNDDALSLPAGKLMRKTIQKILGRLQACIFERPPHAFAAFIQIGNESMHDQRFGDDLFDGLHWVERFVWILKDHLDTLADRLAFACACVRDVPAFEEDRAFGGFLEPHQRQRERGLAASALADQRDDFAAFELQVHIVHRVDEILLPRKPARSACGKILLEVSYFEDVIVWHDIFSP